MDIGILNVVTYVPLVGALWILFFLDEQRNIRWGATFFEPRSSSGSFGGPTSSV